MSTDWTARVWAYSRHKGSAKLLLLAIAHVADDTGSTTALTIAALEQLTGTKERNIQLLLARLEQSGEVQRELGAGPHGRTRYTLCYPPLPHADVITAHPAAPVMQQPAPPAHLATPQTDVPECATDVVLYTLKEGKKDGGGEHAHPLPQTDASTSPSDNHPPQPDPLSLWETGRETVQPLDVLHLQSLNADLDRATQGCGSYWLAQAILAASATDAHFATNPRALNLVRAILRRWRTEGSWGSDTPTYTTYQEHPNALPRHPHRRLAVPVRRPANQPDTRAARGRAPGADGPRTSACTIIGLDTDGDGRAPLS